MAPRIAPLLTIQAVEMATKMVQNRIAMQELREAPDALHSRSKDRTAIAALLEVIRRALSATRKRFARNEGRNSVRNDAEEQKASDAK